MASSGGDPRPPAAGDGPGARIRMASPASSGSSPPASPPESAPFVPHPPEAQEFSRLQDATIPEELPGLVLLSAVVFPYEVASVQIDRPRSVRMLEENPGENVVVACFFPAEGDGEIEGGAHGRIHPVGVACRVIHRMRMPNQTIQAVFQG